MDDRDVEAAGSECRITFIVIPYWKTSSASTTKTTTTTTTTTTTWKMEENGPTNGLIVSYLGFLIGSERMD